MSSTWSPCPRKPSAFLEVLPGFGAYPHGETVFFAHQDQGPHDHFPLQSFLLTMRQSKFARIIEKLQFLLLQSSSLYNQYVGKVLKMTVCDA